MCSYTTNLFINNKCHTEKKKKIPERNIRPKYKRVITEIYLFKKK